MALFIPLSHDIGSPEVSVDENAGGGVVVVRSGQAPQKLGIDWRPARARELKVPKLGAAVNWALAALHVSPGKFASFSSGSPHWHTI